MTKDEIVDQVLDAVAGGFYKSGWSYTAQIIEQEESSQRKEVAAALAPIAERMAAESRERAVMWEAMEALKEGDFYSWCYVRGGPGAGLDTSVAEDYILNVTWLLSTLPTLKPTAPATPAEPAPPSLEYVKYRRTQIAEMVDWYDGFDMSGVSVSQADRTTGSPKAGDKIARNPDNHDDKWLVAKAYFDKNFAAISSEVHTTTTPSLEPTAPAAPAEPTSEKARRVYYQDIVYSVCSVLDEIDGRKAGSGIICGTAETPSTEVQDRMKRLLAEWRNRATTTEPSKPSLEAALAVVLEAVQRTSASAIIVCQNGYRVGDGAYEAAWRVAEKLNQLARERNSEEISARQADVDAARKALAEAEAELAKVKGGAT